jgi:lipocalin
MFLPTFFTFALFAGAFSFSPVTEFNPDAYVGRWYQAFSDLAVTATFENSSFCVTADYGFYPNGTFSVLNRERQYSVDGPERVIYGWAEQDTGTAAGELTVHLQTTNFPAPYWIYELGPQTYNGSSYQGFQKYSNASERTNKIPAIKTSVQNTGLYTYSIVSDPFHLTLFVLARNLTDFYENYQDSVLQTLKEAGYTNFLNTPSQTIQENCTYYD